ncbi:MAG TPA: NlpC/P60 family protein [Tianweitania sediminis]|jgi:NlpC/P60 family putative phage cell wall peptidase|nr:NlpC/P60 family protein [Tianweitania sediminis]
MRTEACINERVVAEALSWRGTPYRHQGRQRGVGCDCLGLIVGVWQGLYGKAPAMVPDTYSLDWAETGADDLLLQAARAHFRACPSSPEIGVPAPGNLMLLRWHENAPATHCAIALPQNRMIHAYEQHGVVVSALNRHWRNRIAGVFAFPAHI